MAIATASNLEVHAGSKQLFSDLSFKLEPGERMTLSGRNGAGKTTLLRVLAGELAADAGTLAMQKGAVVALHDQRPPLDARISLHDYVFSGRQAMIEAERELERLEALMAAGPPEPETMAAYATVQQRLEHGGGYRWRDQVLSVLRGLGFAPEQAERPLSSFSGGELTRASLVRALASRPDLLLLDEPTNHLDILSLEWLEEYLTELDAAVVLVAHDRWFLEAVGTSVLELEAGRGRFFAGPWHAWRTEQAARQIALGKAIERQQAEIARMERFVERFRYKASKAKQAQSKLKKIDKVRREGVTADPRDTRNLRFSFKAPERAGRYVLKVQDARIEVPGRVLASDVSLLLERDEHIVLIGPNGAGKTTLIEALAGLREPAAGKVSHGHNVQVGYLSQHTDLVAGEGTVLDAVQERTGLGGQHARDLLGAFLFSGADANKRLNQLSGGEQRRLSLAILVSSGANLLILDEPTNHLDIESREALEDALLAFEGAVILVSHDRALLEAVGSRTVVIAEGTLESHPVGWATYQREADERKTAVTAAGSSPHKAPKKSPGKRGAAKGPSKNAKRRLAELEAQIEDAESALRELEAELADPAAWSSPSSSRRAAERHQQAKGELNRLYGEWESAQG